MPPVVIVYRGHCQTQCHTVWMAVQEINLKVYTLDNFTCKLSTKPGDWTQVCDINIQVQYATRQVNVQESTVIELTQIITVFLLFSKIIIVKIQ